MTVLSIREMLWIRRLSADEEVLYLARKAEKETEMYRKPNIYFAGSITSGRDDQPIYAEIIRLLSLYGRVLTSHVGNARLTVLGEQDHTPCAIYERNMEWLAQSKAMVAEATIPSFGVGYEVAKAEGLSIPVLLLYRESPSHRLTAMADGNPFLRVVHYHQFAELENHFRVFFEAVRLTALWRMSAV